MKIGLVSKQYTLKKGGLEKYTIFLSRELVHAGHEVHVFANNWQVNADITIHKVPMIPFLLPLKNLILFTVWNEFFTKIFIEPQMVLFLFTLSNAILIPPSGGLNPLVHDVLCLPIWKKKFFWTRDAKSLWPIPT
jgi:glycosyltransferase involved in cell wall biosynthesis